MQQKALIFGVLLAFAAFFLMIVSMVLEASRSKKSGRMARSVESQQVIVESEVGDLGGLQIVTGEDGSPMVLVPEGPFQMGSPPGEGDPDESPQRTVYLSAFYIDLYEIDFEKYNDFVKATQRHKPFIPLFEDDQSLIMRSELPAVGLSWEDARDYCTWVGKRLPTEAEWEKAARGERGFRWPWGNTFGEAMANGSGEEDGYKYVAPPGQYELGRSAYGLYDAAGNVAEWVADRYDAEYYLTGPFRDPKGPVEGEHRVYRGGSWNDLPVGLRAAKRYAASSHQTGAVIGFRCAKDVS